MQKKVWIFFQILSEVRQYETEKPDYNLVYSRLSIKICKNLDLRYGNFCPQL
jgi:hypothetical protein